MSNNDKKGITPAYEYKVDGYRYQLMRDIAIANNSAVDNLVGALTSLTISESNMISFITMLEDEVREREVEVSDLTSENLYLGDEVSNHSGDIKRLHRIIDHKDSIITRLTCDNEALNKEIEALKKKIAYLEAKKSDDITEDKE